MPRHKDFRLSQEFLDDLWIKGKGKNEAMTRNHQVSYVSLLSKTSSCASATSWRMFAISSSITSILLFNPAKIASCHKITNTHYLFMAHYLSIVVFSILTNSSMSLNSSKYSSCEAISLISIVWSHIRTKKFGSIDIDTRPLRCTAQLKMISDAPLNWCDATLNDRSIVYEDVGLSQNKSAYLLSTCEWTG